MLLRKYILFAGLLITLVGAIWYGKLSIAVASAPMEDRYGPVNANGNGLGSKLFGPRRQPRTRFRTSNLDRAMAALVAQGHLALGTLGIGFLATITGGVGLIFAYSETDSVPSTTAPSRNFAPIAGGLVLFIAGLSVAAIQIRYEYGFPAVVLFRMAACLVTTGAGTMLFSCPLEKSPAKAPLYFLLSVMMIGIMFLVLFGHIVRDYFHPTGNRLSIGTEIGVVTILTAILIFVSSPFFIWRFNRTKSQGSKSTKSFDWIVYLVIAIIGGFGIDFTMVLGNSYSHSYFFIAMIFGQIIASTLLLSFAFIFGYSRFTSVEFFACSLCCYLALIHPSLLILAGAPTIGFFTLWGLTGVACDLLITAPYAAWIGRQFAEPLSLKTPTQQYLQTQPETMPTMRDLEQINKNFPSEYLE